MANSNLDRGRLKFEYSVKTGDSLFCGYFRKNLKKPQKKTNLFVQNEQVLELS